MKRKLRVRLAGQPSGGQQTVISMPVQPASVQPNPPVQSQQSASATKPQPNPPVGGPAVTSAAPAATSAAPQSPAGGQPPSQKTVTSTTTSTTTRQKMSKRMKWGIAALVVIFAIMIVMIVGMSKAREADRSEFLAVLDEATTREVPAEVESGANEERILDPDVTFVEGEGNSTLDSDVTFVGEGNSTLDPNVTFVGEDSGSGVMESDGSTSLDSSVTFVTSEKALVQLQTTSAIKSVTGVTISYRWIVAPEGSFALRGEAWDHWIPGQEKMVHSVTGGDTGTIFVPVTSWDNVSHARILASGDSQQWEACGGFILVE